jgi:hypothetical protein
MTKRQEIASRGKGHLRMEELTEAINSSSHSKVFVTHWNMDKDKRNVASQEKFYCNHMTKEILKAVLALRRNQDC